MMGVAGRWSRRAGGNEVQAMTSLLKSRRAWGIAILVALALAILWYVAPYPWGVLMARRDHARGHYEVKIYGCPWLPPDEEEKFATYARLLETKYRVELNAVAGCVVTERLVRYVDGYNATMKQLLTEQHGRDILAECERLARADRQPEHPQK
jgi:hypothetical protein